MKKGPARNGQKPLPAELFSLTQLEKHARALSGRRELGPVEGRDRLLSRLDDNEAALREAYALVSDAVALGRRITPAAEWFIDNYHLIEEQVRAARLHLPRRYSHELPRLMDGPSAGMPRVYELAIELISHSHGRVDGENLGAFVAAFQTGSPLSLGELWAVPIMLRLALLENLRRIVGSVTAGIDDREDARRWADQLLEGSAAPATAVLVLADLVKADPALSPPFVAELVTRLRGQAPVMAFPIAWLEQCLATESQTIEQVLEVVSKSQAADQVAIGNTIGSLRFVTTTNWQDFVEASSVVERALNQDPAGVYGTMDFATRDNYRHVVEALARLAGADEPEVARAAVDLARSSSGSRVNHVGYYLLVPEGRARLEEALGAGRGVRATARRLSWSVLRVAYAVAIFSLTAAISAGFLVGAASALGGWTLALLLLPVAIASSQLAIAVVHAAVSRFSPPRRLPRLDFSKAIPSEHRTLIAVPTMLTDPTEVDALLESLEVHQLANPDPELCFALITDFRDASHESIEGDEELLHRARDGIRNLNARHPGRAPFHLLHRSRRYNDREGVWMGWERKRGKIEQLNDALRGDHSGFHTVVGDHPFLLGVRYVIALDSDTHLPRDAARELAAAMGHPLNRPHFDPSKGRVTEGHGILQPRVATTLKSLGSSRFARLHGGEPGIDPYTRAVSDVYQDAFDEGSYVGKGIYDVDALRAATTGRLPENRVLSHDLLEGALARAGLLSDVLLFEDQPSAYAADVARRVRWLRGDWQLAAWLGRRVPGGDGGKVENPLSWLSQWKIFDNLRRSLVPVALLALLLGGWATPGLASPITALVVSVLIVPGLIAAGLTRRPEQVPRHRHVREIAAALGTQLGREVFALACLPHTAQLTAVAIARTGARLVTQRKLLEWRTAADAQRVAQCNLGEMHWAMASAPVCAVGSAIAVAWLNPSAFPAAAPVWLSWLLAPLLAWWTSQPLTPAAHQLGAFDVSFLRKVARRTWRFFEVFVSAADRYLPPDNFQEDPPQGIAHRTSPTNIGVSLTATLAAYDFGHVSVATLIERTTRTLDSLEALPRHRGHFYNWYDTQTLEPLPPMYVSTVDSGNLAGHLLTLAAGLEQLAHQPIFRPQVFAGLADTLGVLVEAGATGLSDDLSRLELQAKLRTWTLPAARDRLEQLASGRERRLAAVAEEEDGEMAWWAQAFENEVGAAREDLQWIAPWLLEAKAERPERAADLDRPPSLAETAALAGQLAPGLAVKGVSETWLHAMRLASSRAASRLEQLASLAARCRELAEMDHDFLYDPDRHLMAIGYNVTDHRRDLGFYDLLASEARLASFVAIAQGKLPKEHWFSLGRLLTTTAGHPALLSWSGSMFEYLMPLLVMPSYPGTMLEQTYRGVVERQIEYGRARKVPWGVSESGYNKTDAQLNYQYRAFGVPGLGFKRGLADDLVIAPYASAMALMIDPRRACLNLRRLDEEQRQGPYGYYEAVDYTPSRLPPGHSAVTVKSYMAHHQGMALLSIAYVLLDRPMQRRFESLPAFRATSLLLQERVPRTPPIYPHPAEVSAAGEAVEPAGPSHRVYATAHTPSPAVKLLSNGTYHVAVTNAGGGYSRWRDVAVTRWREDPTRDRWGSFCYVRDLTDGRFWSVTHQPTLVEGTSYEAVFSLGRAEFRRRDGDLDALLEISVSPEDDVELRRLSITNLGRAARTIDLTSYAEVVLASSRADDAHPAFSNLFVQTELVRSRGAILCTRRARSGKERPPWMLHLMMVHGARAGETSFETSRASFIGRGRDAVDPAAMHRRLLENHEGAVLDPVVAIRNSLRIDPDETARVHLATGVAETREGALALIGKYSERHSADRVFELAWTHNQVLLRRLDVTEAETQLYERLASKLLYSSADMRAPRSVIARNKSGQSALWPQSISGDLPIALVRVSHQDNQGIVRQMLQAHAYWRLKGVMADLVIWNEDPTSYRQVLQDEIIGLVGVVGESALLDQPGGIFVRRSEQLTEEDRILLQTVARVIATDSGGTLLEQVDRRSPAELPVRNFRATRVAPSSPAVRPIAPPDLAAWNGLGGFTRDGREYVTLTSRGARTPAPWVNVLANPYFGTVVSESGSAYTWCENAHGHRLTPWSNDAVSDASGEVYYLRDEETGRFWSPTPLPAGGPQPYKTRHGFGYSIFEYEDGGIASELKTYVAVDAPLKFMVFRLTNRSGRVRRLSVTALYELVLGTHRAANSPHVVSELDPSSGALFARNAFTSEFASRVAFLDCSVEQRTVLGDRLEFIGRNGTLANPQCMGRAHLSGRVGAGLDPCLAMQVGFELRDGEEREVAFTFGSGRDVGDARTLVHRFRGTAAAWSALESVWAYYKRALGTVTVHTPDAALDFLANGWLLQQVLAARLWGRSGFYQSGGAFGFRDQLQDAMALVHAEPALLREQILLAASRQFREGDVQHWWHPLLGRGVRTRISDDYLFLPSAVCRYIGATADTGILEEIIPFLEGRSVDSHEDSYYDLPLDSDESGSLYEHCVRAIEHGLRFGAHGLPLMGTGDWNDGMNLVGDEGKGESVWLGFFLYDVLERFSALAESRGDESFAGSCRREAATLRGHLEQHGWDGEWYRRAWARWLDLVHRLRGVDVSTRARVAARHHARGGPAAGRSAHAFVLGRLRRSLPSPRHSASHPRDPSSRRRTTGVARERGRRRPTGRDHPTS